MFMWKGCSGGLICGEGAKWREDDFKYFLKTENYSVHTNNSFVPTAYALLADGIEPLSLLLALRLLLPASIALSRDLPGGGTVTTVKKVLGRG